MNINQLVLEAVKEQNPWKTGEILRRIRRDKIHELKKKMNVSFDLENDEPSGDKRDIRIQVGTYPGGDPQLNKFKCQMMKAGGDWEYPVAYFFCQLIEGRLNQFGDDKQFIGGYHSGDKAFFCFIPMKDNSLLQKEGKYIAYNQDSKKEEVPEINESSCWKQLNEYLEKISNVKYQEGPHTPQASPENKP